MNAFAKHRSYFFIFLAWFFAVALFADSVNLTDIFSSTVTLHFDEGDGSGVVEQFLAAAAAPTSSHSFPGDIQRGAINKHKKAVPKQVILDEDSPSLPALSVNSLFSTELVPREEKVISHGVILTESLFLQHCTLLL